MVIDVYHVWWDPAVYSEIEPASDHIFGFHVNDWIVPVPDMLNGRGIMGDGVIAIKRLREVVTQAGYNGPIEVEIFNEELWQFQAANYFGSSKTGSFSMSKTLDTIEEPSIRPGTWRGGAFGHTSY